MSCRRSVIGRLSLLRHGGPRKHYIEVVRWLHLCRDDANPERVVFWPAFVLKLKDAFRPVLASVVAIVETGAALCGNVEDGARAKHAQGSQDHVTVLLLQAQVLVAPKVVDLGCQLWRQDGRVHV